MDFEQRNKEFESRINTENDFGLASLIYFENELDKYGYHLANDGYLEIFRVFM